MRKINIAVPGALALVLAGAMFLNVKQNDVHAQSSPQVQGVIVQTANCVGASDGSPNEQCGTTVTWPIAFTSGNYALTCTADDNNNQDAGLNFPGATIEVSHKTARTFSIASYGQAGAPFSCIAVMLN